jgi:hypothetical protein
MKETLKTFRRQPKRADGVVKSDRVPIRSTMKGGAGMTLIVIGLVIILILLIAMRLRSKSASLGSTARPTRDRRSGNDRRKKNVPVSPDRRRWLRRMDDVAARYVDRLEQSRAD